MNCLHVFRKINDWHATVYVHYDINVSKSFLPKNTYSDLVAMLRFSVYFLNI